MSDMRKEEQNKKQRNPIAKIILAILVIIILLLLHRCSVNYYEKKVVEEANKIIKEFEENVDAITEIEDAMRQEAVDTAVEEGMMHVNYSAKAVFNGKVSETFNLKNIENNHDSIMFEIFDEDGKSLYKSKMIKPGYEMNAIELKRALPEGRHECTIRIQYATSGSVASEFPIILEVK